ncbi:fumarylpyruvate hydrolase [Dysgonomonadaceae bacterium PH5-43]|nr:fumarylpyruvate hydrolase [Dysgonomonadaceae bacterium PH5-43]
MKIICVGLNYKSHNKEFDNSLKTKELIIFMKPDTSLLKDGKPFYIPDFSSEMEYETEIVVKINRLGKNIAKRFAHRYYEEVTVGIDMTARDLQRDLRKLGLPWELSKSFDNSAIIGDFIKLEDLKSDINNLDFHLDIDGQTVQAGNSSSMVYKVDEIIEYVSKFVTLKIGDLIFTGTPAGVGNVAIGNNLQGFINNNKLLDLYIK